MRSLTALLIAEKNKIAAGSAWLTLLQVQVAAASWIYLVPNPAAVIFNGITYNPFPCKLEPLTSDSKGGLPEISISISNVTREISGYLEANDMRGRAVKIIGVNSANLSDPAAKIFEEEYEITEIGVTEQVAVFRLGHVRFLQQVFPAGRFLRDNCRWTYKSTECGYAGGLATCAKILEGSNGCRTHANQARFGGFPALPSVRQ